MADLTITRGDDEVIDLAAKKPDGTVLDLTGATIWFYAKHAYSDTDANAVIAKDTTGAGVVITDALNGLAEVRFTPADTESLPSADIDVPLLWEVQARDVGSKVYTLGKGFLTIESDIVLAPGSDTPTSLLNSFTYDPTTDAGKVRLLAQDFDTEEPIFSDAEIQAFLDLNGANVKYAAAQALEVIAANEVYVQKRIHLLDLQTDGPREAEQLLKLAATLRTQAATTDAGVDELFDWAEMVTNPQTASERLWAEMLRNYT